MSSIVRIYPTATSAESTHSPSHEDRSRPLPELEDSAWLSCASLPHALDTCQERFRSPVEVRSRQGCLPPLIIPVATRDGTRKSRGMGEATPFSALTTRSGRVAATVARGASPSPSSA